jgi:flagellar basal body rod protein FlgF
LAADIGFVRTTLADGTLEATGVADRVAIAADLWLAVQRA